MRLSLLVCVQCWTGGLAVADPTIWRTGRRNPRNVYVQFGAEPGDEDLSIGMLDNALLAAEAVTAVNQRRRAAANDGAGWYLTNAEKTRIEQAAYDQGLLAAALAGREPTDERVARARAALIEAWPDLGDDPVYVEQLAATALNAAYNPSWRMGTPVPADTREDPPGERSPACPHILALLAEADRHADRGLADAGDWRWLANQLRRRFEVLVDEPVYERRTFRPGEVVTCGCGRCERCAARAAGTDQAVTG